MMILEFSCWAAEPLPYIQSWLSPSSRHIVKNCKAQHWIHQPSLTDSTWFLEKHHQHNTVSAAISCTGHTRIRICRIKSRSCRGLSSLPAILAAYIPWLYQYIGEWQRWSVAEPRRLCKIGRAIPEWQAKIRARISGADRKDTPLT